MAGSPGRIVLADDDVLLREGIASLLASAGYEVVGKAGNGVDLLALVEEQRPDTAVIDIRMPPTHTTEGIDAAHAIRASFPEVALLLLSAHVDVEHALEILAGGDRVGYLLKSRVTDVGEFLDALARIRAGGSVIDQEIVEELIEAPRRQDPLAPLSPRELEVLALMAEGRSNAGIAQRLSISEGAVEKHIRSILGKLDLSATANDHRRVLAVVAYLDSL
jgi:DNA-binding NarL/FixJ family response regulator